MKKNDLNPGMVIEKRDGRKRLLVITPNYLNLVMVDFTDGILCDYLKNYDNNLNCIHSLTAIPAAQDIVKVYKDYTCQEVLWEREERPVLTETEKTILRNIDPMYKYIARDGGHEGLVWIYPTKPRKNTCGWSDGGGLYEHLKLFNHLFKFVKWEDEQPYSIAYLLGESEVNE